jgi:ADP-ribose pyrophosphatase YjhB (NUDIX family)
MPNDKTLWARIRHRLFHTLFRFTRPVTLGVRAVIVDDQKRVFMVRHGYVEGWHFPGGGVETGETAIEAIRKEVMEEGCIAIAGARLHGLFFNSAASPRDHVAVFVIDNFRIEGQRTPDYEIAETGWFPINALPPGVTRGTRQRLAEIFDAAPLSETWS